MGTRKAARAQEPRHSSTNPWPEPGRGSFRSLVNLTLSPPQKKKKTTHWSLLDFVSNLLRYKQQNSRFVRPLDETQRAASVAAAGPWSKYESLPHVTDEHAHARTRACGAGGQLIIEKLSNETCAGKHFLSDAELRPVGVPREDNLNIESRAAAATVSMA